MAAVPLLPPWWQARSGSLLDTAVEILRSIFAESIEDSFTVSIVQNFPYYACGWRSCIPGVVSVNCVKLHVEHVKRTGQRKDSTLDNSGRQTQHYGQIHGPLLSALRTGHKLERGPSRQASLSSETEVSFQSYRLYNALKP